MVFVRSGGRSGMSRSTKRLNRQGSVMVLSCGCMWLREEFGLGMLGMLQIRFLWSTYLPGGIDHSKP